MKESPSKRKARLKALRDDVMEHTDDDKTDVKRQRTNEDNVGEVEEKVDDPVIKFRSYQPLTKTLAENVMPEADIPNLDNDAAVVTKASEGEIIEGDVDILTLAPRKPDWDLKRDLDKKLKKLERRTERAIAELVHERYLKEGNPAGLKSNEEELEN